MLASVPHPNRRRRALAAMVARRGVIALVIAVGVVPLAGRVVHAQTETVDTAPDMVAQAASGSDETSPPPGFAVLPFANRSGSKSLDWLGYAAAFVLGEKIEHHVRLRPTYGVWVLPRGWTLKGMAAATKKRLSARSTSRSTGRSAGRSSGRSTGNRRDRASGAAMGQDTDTATAAAPEPVIDAQTAADYGSKIGATWLMSGWIDGNRAALQFGLELWRIDAGGAVMTTRIAHTAPFEETFAVIGALVAEVDSLVGQGNVSGENRAGDSAADMAAPITADLYAFTIFGRALAEIAKADGNSTRARTYLRKAASQLKRAIVIDPAMAPAHRLLGEIHALLGNIDDARRRLDAALRLAPGYPAALSSRADMARRDREPERSERLYRDALVRRPWDVDRRFALGRMLWEHGKLEEAVDELTRVVAHKGDHIEARRLLVDAYSRMGDQEALLSELETLRRIDPADVDSRFDLAAVYLAAGAEAEAVAVYESLTGVPRARGRALGLLGDLARRRGDRAGAETYYRAAMSADDSDARPHFMLASLYLDAGDLPAARQVFRSALKFKRYAAIIHGNLGAIAYRMGRYPEAVWYARRAVYLQPKRPRYRYHLALALSAMGDTLTAVYEIRQGLRRDPNDVDLQYLYGVVELRRGRHDAARAWFESVLRLDSRHLDARHNLNRLLELADSGDEQATAVP